jgi:DNA-binding transcriptional regulator YiaG
LPKSPWILISGRDGNAARRDRSYPNSLHKQSQIQPKVASAGELLDKLRHRYDGENGQLTFFAGWANGDKSPKDSVAFGNSSFCGIKQKEETLKSKGKLATSALLGCLPFFNLYIDILSRLDRFFSIGLDSLRSTVHAQAQKSPRRSRRIAVKEKLREEFGMSQEEFAREIGTSARTVSRWEAGDDIPTFTIAQMKALDRLLRSRAKTLDDLPDEFGSTGQVSP